MFCILSSGAFQSNTRDRQVAANAEANKMNEKNLAIVFAPTILYSDHQTAVIKSLSSCSVLPLTVQQQSMIEEAEATQSTIEFLLKFSEKINVTVPDCILGFK